MAEAMNIYRSGKFRLSFTPEIAQYLKERQKDFMPEDTKAGMIQAYLETYTGNTVCSKQLYKEALNHPYDEPKQWEIRKVNEIMNQCAAGWKYFSNPRMFGEYGQAERGGNVTTGPGQPAGKSKGRFCGSAGADGAAVLKMQPRCRLRCQPVAVPVAWKMPIIQGFPDH